MKLEAIANIGSIYTQAMKSTILTAIFLLLAIRCEGQNLHFGATLGGDAGDETDGVKGLEIRLNYPRGETGLTNHHFMEFGFVGGFEFEYSLNQMWALDGSLLYDQKGAGLNYIYFSEAGGEYRDTMDLTLNYLEIPLTAKLNFRSGGVGPFLFAGPSFGFLLSGKAQHHPVINNESGGSISLFQVNQPSISVMAGIGFSFDLSETIRGALSASYAWGLTNDSFNQVGFGYAGGALYRASARDIRLKASVLFPG